VSIPTTTLDINVDTRDAEEVKWKDFRTNVEWNKKKDMVAVIVSAYNSASQKRVWKEFNTDHRVAHLRGTFDEKLDISENEATQALRLLEPTSFQSDPTEIHLSQDLASRAFRVTYKTHNDDDNFLSHLQQLRQNYKPSKNAPYFAVIQSSGYGKFRMIYHFDRVFIT